MYKLDSHNYLTDYKYGGNRWKPALNAVSNIYSSNYYGLLNALSAWLWLTDKTYEYFSVGT